MNSNSPSESLDRIQSNKKFNISAIFSIGFSIIVVCVFLGLLVTPEEHNARNAYDVDCFRRHLCPIEQYPMLNQSMSPSPSRPDENQLWADALNAERSDDRPYFIANKQHFIFEVRRTIFEFEKGNPVNYPFPTNRVKSPFYAHAVARTEVMQWYEGKKLLPPNFQRDPFD